MKLPWRPSQRRALLDRYFALFDKEGDERVWQQRALLLEAYMDGLPRMELSRCPYTHFELRHTLDPYGLDGLWWDSWSPARPRNERPYFCHAITGAVTLGTPVEVFAHTAMPGPAVPYVIPALLADARVTAVVSSFPCGRHRAYCVAYFSPEECDGLPWPNDWGTNRRWSEGGTTSGGWYEALDMEEVRDFELGPYIERGKLFWIAPDDPQLALRRGLPGCPYLHLPGERRVQYVSQGQVWIGEELGDLETEEAQA
ncbi:MAG: hypothetical protein KIT83_21865 [Bryobacterales bacterium]|nr:hypothetical protein [Bryobacterales bacterium]